MAFQINQQLAFNDVKEFIVVSVLVPVVLALDDSQPNDGIVDLAERLVEPFVSGCMRYRLRVNDLERLVGDVEVRLIRELSRVCHLFLV